MQYLLTFLEGIITFISPCLLPMLPVYLSYFAGDHAAESEQGSRYRSVRNSFGFVLGFTIVFVALGAFAGSLGAALSTYQQVINIVCGMILILFGLNFTGILRLPFINNVVSHGSNLRIEKFFSAVLFGIVFSVSWTPCVGTFLAAALAHAATSGETLQGVLMLLTYSAGLGVPFVLSALLLDRLRSAFDFIKKHYRVINLVSGILLILLGITIASGLIKYVYRLA